MSEDMMIRNCSPTLAGLKTANLFTCPFSGTGEMIDNLRSWNHIFTNKGLRVLPLRYRNGHALIYLYRTSHLSRDLCREDARCLLRERGYTSDNAEQCIIHLKKRIRDSEEFPHEIGLFLGYPPEDVSGFIENQAGGYKVAGCWKVYGDVAAAEETFAKYKKCTEIYSKYLAVGHTVEQLTVAG